MSSNSVNPTQGLKINSKKLVAIFKHIGKTIGHAMMTRSYVVHCNTFNKKNSKKVLWQYNIKENIQNEWART